MGEVRKGSGCFNVFMRLDGGFQEEENQRERERERDRDGDRDRRKKEWKKWQFSRIIVGELICKNIFDVQ